MRRHQELVAYLWTDIRSIPIPQRTQYSAGFYSSSTTRQLTRSSTVNATSSYAALFVKGMVQKLKYLANSKSHSCGRQSYECGQYTIKNKH